MSASEIKIGDFVSYVTKDQFGLQAITAEVVALAPVMGTVTHAKLRTLPDGVTLVIPLDVLTKIKVVRQDTTKLVENKKPTITDTGKPRTYKSAPEIVAALGNVENEVNSGILKARPQSGVAQESRNWASQVHQLFGDYGHASGFLLSDDTILVYWHGVWGIADDMADDGTGRHIALARAGRETSDILSATSDCMPGTADEIRAWAKTLRAAVWVKEDKPKGNLAPRVEEEEEKEENEGHTIECPGCGYLYRPQDGIHICSTVVEKEAEGDPGEDEEDDDDGDVTVFLEDLAHKALPLTAKLEDGNDAALLNDLILKAISDAHWHHHLQNENKRLVIENAALKKRTPDPSDESAQQADHERVVTELREQLGNTQDVVRRQEQRIAEQAKDLQKRTNGTRLSNADLQAVLTDVLRIRGFAASIAKLIESKLPGG